MSTIPSFDNFIEHVLRDHELVHESEWRDDLDGTEGLSDEERVAAAETLRRFGPQPPVVGLDMARKGWGSSVVTTAGVRQAIQAMSQNVAPAMQVFGRSVGKAARAMSQLGQILGARHDLVILDDLVDFHPRSLADRLAASDWYHAHLHPESLKRLVPADPVFPPKVEGETVVPQLGRTCTDPREAHCGEPRWLDPFRERGGALLPPDLLPEPGTPEGHPRRQPQPPLRRIQSKPARGRYRKQRR